MEATLIASTQHCGRCPYTASFASCFCLWEDSAVIRPKSRHFLSPSNQDKGSSTCTAFGSPLHFVGKSKLSKFVLPGKVKRVMGKLGGLRKTVAHMLKPSFGRFTDFTGCVPLCLRFFPKLPKWLKWGQGMVGESQKVDIIYSRTEGQVGIKEIMHIE